MDRRRFAIDRGFGGALNWPITMQSPPTVLVMVSPHGEPRDDIPCSMLARIRHFVCAQTIRSEYKGHQYLTDPSTGTSSSHPTLLRATMQRLSSLFIILAATFATLFSTTCVHAQSANFTISSIQTLTTASNNLRVTTSRVSILNIIFTGPVCVICHTKPFVIHH
jgi:hypothetical protein